MSNYEFGLVNFFSFLKGMYVFFFSLFFFVDISSSRNKNRGKEKKITWLRERTKGRERCVQGLIS